MSDELDKKLRRLVTDRPDPSPSGRADERFRTLLNEAQRPAKVRQFRPVHYAAAATILLLVFAAGLYFGGAADRQRERELAANRSLMLELMGAEKTSDRLRATTVALQLTEADAEVIDNLGYLLLHDENANVRLAALEALERFANLPTTREILLNGLEADPPMVVRLQLIETLFSLGETRVRPYLEEIITNDTLPQKMRDAARHSAFTLL